MTSSETRPTLSNTTLTPTEAVILAALTVIAADGKVEDSEYNTVLRSPLFDGKSFDTALHLFTEVPPSETDLLVDLVARSLTGEQRLCALANILDIAMADGTLADEEKGLLEAYVRAFEIPDTEVTRIVQVISIKNSYGIL